ncbi:MAG TPA: N-acetylmuramoyl-L-alanine amidase [Flavisolibacter sp.]
MKVLLLLAALLFNLLLFGQAALLGRTTGPLPYLEFGPGDDRLGGAKMTYLDTGILLQVVDSLAGDFKVQLSSGHTAYLPKANVRMDTSARKPFYLTGSWRVYGDDRYDYVNVGLTEKLPYRSMQLLSPSKLVVDVFGAVSNTNWITQLKTVKEITNVWQEQIEDDVFRIHIELKHRQHWGHYIFYRNNTLVIRVKRQPASRIRELKIAVDAGHGGANTGASGGATGVLEKDYTLKIAGELEKLLVRKGAKVYMTRNHDTDISMIDRTLLLREQDPDLLVSVHLNSSGNKAANGTSTYYRYIGFRSLSQAILDELLELPLNNFGNIGAFNFALSGPTEYPNCLVEVAFLSNAEDEQKIIDEGFRKNVAKRIYKGIRRWMKDL